MGTTLKTLFVDAATSYYKVKRHQVGDFFGPVDLGLHFAGKYNSLNIGTGLLAGSIFPGSNRLVFTGFSPCWGGFYISSMGGAGLTFDNLGIDMLSIIGHTKAPSILYLNRNQGEEIEVELITVNPEILWKEGRKGVYAVMDFTYQLLGSHYQTDPRILAVGPAAACTDIGGICSVPIEKGVLSYVDTWAGRGGFGSKLYQEHGIVAIIYGGTFADEDFRDRTVADKWFQDKYKMKLAAKDFEATTKYRFDPKFETGGTLGVNYASIGGRMLSFNYQSIYWDEEKRIDIHKRFVLDHYLAQFNEETIIPKQQKTCGEPCAAVCKKMQGKFKKDYEPYQVMGPLTGIFDQRAAEMLNHQADSYGFDAISIGGVLSWLMECLDKEYLTPAELGVTTKPVFSPDNFHVVEDSAHNASLGIELLDSIIQKRGVLNLQEGARKLARQLSRTKGNQIKDCFVYTAFGRKGWMVPNQYWTPGVLSPMPIMGKYYMHYAPEFLEPRFLGRANADRMQAELVMDNMGICRFHRGWAEEMLPEIIESLYGLQDIFTQKIKSTASRINSRNASIFWETDRNYDFVHRFLKRLQTVGGNQDPLLNGWLISFDKDKRAASLDFWYEMHKGAHDSLLEF